MTKEPRMLTTRDLVVRYGRIEAVKGISLRVGAGEIVALIGANGAGKSTTLLAISGVLAAARGSVSFDGRPLSGLSAHEIVRRGVVQVVEGRAIFARLTVVENLLAGAYTRRDRDAVEVDVEKMLDRFPRLRERAAQLGGTLSGGEQQMLAIARALMSRPRLLLLDEPSMGLAPLIVDAIFDFLAELNREGLTILLVEQNAVKALAIAHRAYVMANGKVVDEGESQALLADGRLHEAYLGMARQ
jgi:branched-chain amino acid transport system ATP-binding protein